MIVQGVNLIPAEAMMDTTKQIIEQSAPHSVSLSTNAKGGVQFEVKIYDSDPQAAADRACVILDGLRAKYGTTGG